MDTQGLIDGDTALHVACQYSCLGIVKALVANGANVNIQNKKGDTPLHVAVYKCKFCDFLP